ncbi:hypothetical protein EWB00_004429 [Schistosoma japonicum]|uniref:Uncharacterized protein n=1 Tax=Schistosoma japonicum TaxID=6182 RepID=A0A4Z2D5B9_SCHJA|nr:hypothetical protein EWB00_004429 [Schistosoma japonicum]
MGFVHRGVFVWCWRIELFECLEEALDDGVFVWCWRIELFECLEEALDDSVADENSLYGR